MVAALAVTAFFLAEANLISDPRDLFGALVWRD